MAKRPPPQHQATRRWSTSPTADRTGWRSVTWPRPVCPAWCSPRPRAGGCRSWRVGHGWLQSATGTPTPCGTWRRGASSSSRRTPTGASFSSHQGLALDLSRALRMVAYGELGGGRVRGDLRRLGVLGHSTGGGAAVLAAAKDDQIRAVVTVTAAETKPSAVEAAGRVEAPSLHLIGAEGRLGRIGRREDRPILGRARAAAQGQGLGHLGLAEGSTSSTTSSAPTRTSGCSR